MCEDVEMPAKLPHPDEIRVFSPTAHMHDKFDVA